MSVDVKLDLNGKVCPMPAALTRKALRKMTTGQILEVFGDFEPALENIVAMAKKTNAEVLESESKKNYFKIIMKKL